MPESIPYMTQAHVHERTRGVPFSDVTGTSPTLRLPARVLCLGLGFAPSHEAPSAVACDDEPHRGARTRWQCTLKSSHTDSEVVGGFEFEL